MRNQLGVAFRETLPDLESGVDILSGRRPDAPELFDVEHGVLEHHGFAHDVYPIGTANLDAVLQMFHQLSLAHTSPIGRG